MNRRCIFISEFGLKIKNIEASTLFEYNNGIRDRYECKDAMFANSLFYDFLIKQGLRVWKNKSTRDIICLEFNFGSKSYQKELRRLYEMAGMAKHEYSTAKIQGDKYLTDKTYVKIKKITELMETAYKNKYKYKSLSKEQLRTLFYNNGVSIEYNSYTKNGGIKKSEIIHYKMLYRSTGKAKKGSCVFIRDKLYKKALNFLYMGIKLPKKNPMIVEMSAYAPLVSSGIVGKIKINPKNILILKDAERFFETNVISVETDDKKHCIVKKIDNYKLKNTLFDGQALIDSGIFPDWGNGYILLRHHFCKMAAFSANIQDFFKDYLGGDYNSAIVKDMFGNEHYVKDIKIITTDNAMKWIKFNKTYEYWCEKVNENDCMFGIVKTAHKSKLGDVQKMSYQMVNSLDNKIMGNVTQKSVHYIERLKTDNNVFFKYLKDNSNFANDYEVLIALCEQNPDFVRSEYFRERKKKIIETYVLNIKSGELIQNAENLTIVGSPYAMLLYAVKGNEAEIDNDTTLTFEKGSVQCYTERFKDGEYLAFFRSPFNSKNNLTYLHNTYSDILKKYFNFGKQVIAVNMIGTDFQDRNNGSDQDSDFGYTTNQKDIVGYARECYLNFPTIVNNIPKEKTEYSNAPDDYAKMDNSLARSQIDIGEASNLAQIAQTYAGGLDNPKYNDYVCILSVLAQVAIDNAKRRFDINLPEEIKRIKNDMDLKTNKYPKFWSIIKKEFNKEKINKKLNCPMDYLYDLDFGKFRNKETTLPMSNFFNRYELNINRKKCKKIEELIEKYSLDSYLIIEKGKQEYSDYLLLRNDFNDLIQDIKKVRISGNYLGLMSWLIDRAFLITANIEKNKNNIKTTINKNKSLLLKVLYDINKDNLLKCFSKNT